MQINVTKTDEMGWKPDSSKPDTLYTIHIEGQGEPQKTWFSELNVLGSHDAEAKVSEKGKTYWKPTKSSQPYSGKRSFGGAKTFKADPDKMKQEFSLEVARNQSIQRQVALKAAVEIVVAAGGVDPTDNARPFIRIMVDEYFDHFMGLLHTQWQPKDEHQPVKDEGDYIQINPTDFEDQPPIEAYEDNGTGYDSYEDTKNE